MKTSITLTFKELCPGDAQLTCCGQAKLPSRNARGDGGQCLRVLLFCSTPPGGAPRAHWGSTPTPARAGRLGSAASQPVPPAPCAHLPRGPWRGRRALRPAEGARARPAPRPGPSSGAPPPRPVHPTLSLPTAPGRKRVLGAGTRRSPFRGRGEPPKRGTGGDPERPHRGARAPGSVSAPRRGSDRWRGDGAGSRDGAVRSLGGIPGRLRGGGGSGRAVRVEGGGGGADGSGTGASPGRRRRSGPVGDDGSPGHVSESG